MREIVVHFLDLDLELDKSMVQFDVREDKREIAGSFRGFISGEEGVVAMWWSQDTKYKIQNTKYKIQNTKYTNYPDMIFVKTFTRPAF